MGPGCTSTGNLMSRKFVRVLNLTSSRQDIGTEWRWQNSFSLDE